MLKSFLPRERRFFVFFREDAALLMEGLETLDTLLRSEASQFPVQARQLKDLEHQGDEITHRINQELNATFITPFDREDIYALASAVDDVLDLAEETADTIVIDGVEAITDEAREMGAILVQIGRELVQAFNRLESRRPCTEHWVRIHDLENRADRVTRDAIGALFRNTHDPIAIIKWKDVYGLLEETVDRTEDIASILESVTIKNA